MAHDGHDLDSRERELGRTALALALLALVLLIGFYLLVAGGATTQTLRDLALNVIANLIPVLLVLALTLTLLRRSVESERRRELARLREGIVAELTDVVAARPAASGNGSSDTAALARRFGLPETDSIERLSSEMEEAIRDILRVVTAALVDEQSGTVLSLRAFCHIAQRDTGTLRPVVMYSHRATPDFDALIPYEGPESEPFVIARAFREKRIVLQDLPVNHVDGYTPTLRTQILPDLRSVLAAPICGFKPSGGLPAIGTISVDSTLTLAELRVTPEAAGDVLALGATAVHSVLHMWMSVQGGKVSG